MKPKKKEKKKKKRTAEPNEEKRTLDNAKAAADKERIIAGSG